MGLWRPFHQLFWLDFVNQVKLKPPKNLRFAGRSRCIARFGA